MLYENHAIEIVISQERITEELKWQYFESEVGLYIGFLTYSW